MKAIYYGILNLVGFALVLTFNALANILPINGYNTGQVSAFYPNYFVPAGFTFSIWGVIYLLLMGFVICSLLAALPSFPTQARKAIAKASPLFLLSCLLNASWIVAWHYLQIELSVVIMLLFLITLIQLFLKSTTMANALTSTQKFILQTPFIVYLGWISVATIANITALLIAYQWNGFGIAPVYWSAAMILIAIILAVLMVKKFQVVSFTLVVAWALWGIYNAQGPAAPILASLTALGIGVLISTVLFTLIYKLRKNKMA